MEIFAEGGPDEVIDAPRVSALLGRLVQHLTRRELLDRVLVVPPDFTRFHSGAGELAAELYQRMRATHLLPATGTHRAMTADEVAEMFPGVNPVHVFDHDWKNGVARLGEVPAEFVREVSGGRA